MLSVTGAEVSAVRRVAGGALEVRVFNPSGIPTEVAVIAGQRRRRQPLGARGIASRTARRLARSPCRQFRRVLRARAVQNRNGEVVRRALDSPGHKPCSSL